MIFTVIGYIGFVCLLVLMSGLNLLLLAMGGNGMAPILSTGTTKQKLGAILYTALVIWLWTLAYHHAPFTITVN